MMDKQDWSLIREDISLMKREVYWLKWVMGIGFTFLVSLTTYLHNDNKSAIRDIRTEMTANSREVKTELTNDIREVKAQLTDNIREVKAQLTDDIRKLAGRLDRIERLILKSIAAKKRKSKKSPRRLSAHT